MLEALHYSTRCDLDDDHFIFTVDKRDMSFFGFRAIKSFNVYKASVTINSLFDVARNGYYITYTESAEFARQALLKQYAELRNAQKYKTMTDEEIDAEYEERNLYEKSAADNYQKRAILFSLAVKKALLMLEMGLGKSYIGATLSQILVDDESVKSGEILVIAPTTLHDQDNWLGEVHKFSDLTLTKVESEDDFQIPSDMYIVGPERFRIMCETDTGTYNPKNVIIRKKFKCIIFDESAKLKSGTSQLTKIFHRYCYENKIPYVFLMTGLPAPNTVFQLWGQAAALGYWLGENYNAFEIRYGTPRNVTPTKQKYFPKKNAYQEIRDRIELVSIAMTADKYLNLPPYPIEEMIVHLSDEHLKLYKQIEEEYYCVLDTKNSTVTDEIKMYADTETAVRTKLLQNLNGFLITKDAYDVKTTTRLAWNPKLDAIKAFLVEKLKDPSNNAIIWTRFIEELQWIYEELSKYWLCAKGAGQSTMTKKEQLRNSLLFKTDPNCRVMVAHPGAFKYGHTWNKANFTIYSSAPDDHEDYAQSRKRNHRRGQTRLVTELRFIAANTLEKKIWYAMEHKKRLDAFLKAQR